VLKTEFPDKQWSHSANDQLLQKIDATGTAERKYWCDRKCTAHMSENTDTVEELVLSQEDALTLKIHSTVHHFEHKNDVLSHIKNFCFFYYQFLITNISKTVLQILSTFATFTLIIW